MQFKTFGNPSQPVLVFIHGGGLSWWMWQKQIDMISNDYYIITPVLDGHGADSGTPFISISNSSDQLIDYLNEHHRGNVKLIAGLSIGAQIICDALAKQPNITETAIIESALVIPMPFIRRFGSLMVTLTFGLIQKPWFARLQAKQLRLPNDMFPLYYEASNRMTRESLTQITIQNASFPLNPKLSSVNARILIIAGKKEPRIIKQSARKLANAIPESHLMILPRLHHGELSLARPQTYLGILSNWLK